MTESSMIIATMVALIVLLAIGTKVAWALGIAGLFVILALFGASGLRMIGLIAWNKGISFTLTCVPLFIFMGEVIMRSGLNAMVFDGMGRLTKGLPGGVLQTTVASCAAFAAATGSAVACAATIAKVAYPELEKRGYPTALSMGTIAAGGTLGVLIPPSMQFIIYGSLVGESISKLFIAGILPGIMMVFMFCTYIGLTALAYPKRFPPRGKARLLSNLAGLFKMWPIAVLIMLVMGMIYLGVATPTEAAALGAVGSMLLNLIFRRSDFLRVLHEASLGAVSTTAMVIFLITGATVLTFTMTHLGLNDFIISTVLDLGISPLAVFIGLCFLYLVMGMFLDAVSMMVLSLPIFYPLMMQLGFDSVWLGVIVVLLLEQTFLTPPVGFGLYILSGTSGRPIEEVVRGVMPFVGLLFLGIAVLYVFPDIALWLVRKMR